MAGAAGRRPHTHQAPVASPATMRRGTTTIPRKYRMDSLLQDGQEGNERLLVPVRQILAEAVPAVLDVRGAGAVERDEQREPLIRDPEHLTGRAADLVGHLAQRCSDPFRLGGAKAPGVLGLELLPICL